MIKVLLFAALVAALYFLVKRALAKPAVPNRAEAARLLGVAPDADAETVSDAHRRLIAKVHPDAGGNAELAARINKARDVMLRS